MLPPSGHAWRVAQRAQQVRLERTRAGADTAGSAELGELRHLEALVAAGIDAAEGRQVQGHVHGEAVIAAAAAHAHAEARSEEHTSELQSPCNFVCRLLLEKKTEKDRLPDRPPHRRRHDSPLASAAYPRSPGGGLPAHLLPSALRRSPFVACAPRPREHLRA